jgi:hypothetical protein
MHKRQKDLDRFYELMSELEKCNPKQQLKYSDGNQDWISQGIYFFYEDKEKREDGSPRIVRIGTHAVSKGSKTTYWSRLRQHKGTKYGSGNHRGSVFRKLIGQSIIIKNSLTEFSYWGKAKVDKTLKAQEKTLEMKVSEIIGNLNFLSLEVIGESRKNNMRAYIETNSIALLSNLNKQEIDAPSSNWLGRWSGHKDVIGSGLWNSDDTEKKYDPSFLIKLEELIKKQ